MSADTHFDSEEWLRYTRHIQLPKIGVQGQLKLKRSRVLVVGAGGLGSPVLLYLAAAGVGQLTIVDHDIIDITNLQRQILFNNHQTGLSKAESAKTNLLKLNQHLNIEVDTSPLTETNAEQYISKVDLVLDCTDNFATRYLINDICAKLNTPWIYASIHQFSGQCSLFNQNTGCFRCLFPEPPKEVEDCNSAGVLGVLPGLLGTLQANEAIKYLCGLPTPLEGQLLLVDALELQFQKIKLSQSDDCVVCNANSNINLSKDYAISECSTKHKTEIPASEFDHYRQQANIELLDVRSEDERHSFSLGGTHIPLNTIEQKTNKLDTAHTYLCYCQSGKRSLKAAEYLNKNGFTALSVEGGIAEILKQT